MISLALLAGGCAAASWIALTLLLPWLRRQALAHPNARSGHAAPTPQGAGLAIVPTGLAGAALALASAGVGQAMLVHAIAVAAASVLLLWIGFLDDRGLVGVPLRLLAQFGAASLFVVSLPAHVHISPAPLGLERAALVVCLVWAINLTNFMDGMDWLAGAEAIGVCLGIAGLTLLGAAPTWLGGAAAALGGAVLGFMPKNAPVARVFLGDAGSLPLGLLLATLLLHLAAAGLPAAALILPAYFLADATLTLTLRLLRGRRVWVAHRDHFYQRALAFGRSVPNVLAAVALTNAVLVTLALASAWSSAAAAQVTSLAAAAVVTALLLAFLARRPRR